MIDNIIAILIEKGWDTKTRSAQSRLLRDALRERLAREVRLNLAVWDLCKGKSSQKDIADLLSMEALGSLCSLNLPLRVILDDVSLPLKAKALLKGENRKALIDARFKRWSASIVSEVDLVERSWHRMHVLKSRKNVDGEVGNLDYLFHLLRALEIALKHGK